MLTPAPEPLKRSWQREAAIKRAAEIIDLIPPGEAVRGLAKMLAWLRRNPSVDPMAVMIVEERLKNATGKRFALKRGPKSA